MVGWAFPVRSGRTCRAVRGRSVAVAAGADVARSVTVQVKGGDLYKSRIRNIMRRLGAGAVLNVGVLAGAKYPDGLPVAQNALWQEFGTRRMPARPAMRRTIERYGSTWPQAIADTARRTNYDTRRTLTIVGHGIRDQIVRSIAELTDPPLAPSTVARKGFDKPLIETGLYQNSIDFEIVGS